MYYDPIIDAFTTSYDFKPKAAKLPLTYSHKKLDPTDESGWKKGTVLLVRSTRDGSDHIIRFTTNGEKVSEKGLSEKEYNKRKRWGFSAEYELLKSTSKEMEKKKRYIKKDLKEKVLAKQDNKCALCGDVFSEDNHFQIDHIIEMARGGLTEKSNLQALCKYGCHQIKTLAFRKAKRDGNSDLLDWRADQKNLLLKLVGKIQNGQLVIKNQSSK